MANPQLDSLLPNISDTHLQALVNHYQLPLSAPISYQQNFGSLPSGAYHDAIDQMMSLNYCSPTDLVDSKGMIRNVLNPVLPENQQLPDYSNSPMGTIVNSTDTDTGGSAAGGY